MLPSTTEPVRPSPPEARRRRRRCEPRPRLPAHGRVDHVPQLQDTVSSGSSMVSPMIGTNTGLRRLAGGEGDRRRPAAGRPGISSRPRQGSWLEGVQSIVTVLRAGTDKVTGMAASSSPSPPRRWLRCPVSQTGSLSSSRRCRSTRARRPPEGSRWSARSSARARSSSSYLLGVTRCTTGAVRRSGPAGREPAAARRSRPWLGAGHRRVGPADRLPSQGHGHVRRRRQGHGHLHRPSVPCLPPRWKRCRHDGRDGVPRPVVGRGQRPRHVGSPVDGWRSRRRTSSELYRRAVERLGDGHAHDL